jgi:hypothetical protein
MGSEEKGSAVEQAASGRHSRWTRAIIGRVGFVMVATTVLGACRGAVDTDTPDVGCPAVGNSEGVTLEHFQPQHGDASGCPEAAVPDATALEATAADVTGPDATAPDAAAIDATAIDAATDSARGIAPDGRSEAGISCTNSDAGLAGIGIPPGTTATASGTFSPNTPDLAIDGTIATGWNAGAFTGWIQLTFPAPLAFNGIQLVADAAPTAMETYTLTGFQGNTAVPLGSWTDTVLGSCNCTVLLPPMLVAAGTYDAIRIDVQGNQSWVAINEISILTMDCPAGDGGSFGMDAGAQDATAATDTGTEAGSLTDATTSGSDAQEAAASESGAPMDAAGDSGEDRAL